MPVNGRPAWKPSVKDPETVRMMTAVGIDQDQICRFFRITQKTLRKHCRAELDEGAVEANMAVGRSMYQMALKAPYATRFMASRYWLATRAGWRDGDRVNVIQIPMASFEMSTEQLDELLKREEAHRREQEAAGDGAVVQFPKPPRRRS